jgi:hypothetical protein
MKKKLLLIGFALSLTMNAQVPSYVPTNGLVGYYPFSGNTNDLSGNGYNGANNGATLTTDRFGNPNSAYSFNGTTNYITLGSSFTSGSSPKSFSVWFYLNSASYSFILSGGDPLTNGEAFGLYYDESMYLGNLPHKLIFHGNGLNYDYGFGEIAFQSWNHVVITYDGALVSAYLNGTYIGNSNKTLNTLDNLVRIGGRSNNTAYLDGKIDDVGIWNRALTQVEISSLYNSQSLCQSLSFSNLNNMPSNRGLISSTTDGSNIYVCNGFSPTVGYTTQIEKYNIVTNTWSTFSNTNAGLRYSSAEVVGNKLYVFNGISSSTVFNDKMEVIDLTTGVVTYSTVNPSPVRSAGSSVWNGKIYSFGGTGSSGNSNKLYVFDPVLQTWTALTNMPQAKEAKGEIINGKLYVIGGFNSAFPAYSTSIDCYDIQTNTWSHLIDMPVANSANATTAYQNKIWVVGDYDNLTFVGFYDVITNQFVSIQNNIIARRHAGAIALNNNLYAFGGNQTSLASSSLNSLQVANITNFTNVPNVGYTSPQTYTIGTAISPITPINTSGSCSLTYSISPALPSGLNLNTATGIISGTPTASVPISTYSITACNNFVCVTSTLILSTTLDINDFSYNSLKLFPNPTHYILNILLNNEIILEKVTIVDITGKVVLEQIENVTTINVEKLAKGVYILTAYAGDNKYQEKFIKE